MIKSFSLLMCKRPSNGCPAQPDRSPLPPLPPRPEPRFMSEPVAPASFPVKATAIGQAHQLYCQLTGHSLRLAFDRERMRNQLLRLGYSLQDLRTVILYLQREIRAQRRNVGALKLSNLLQPDRFEEDLQISRVRLRPLPPCQPAPPPPPPLSPADQQRGRQRAVECLRQIKAGLR